MENGGLSSPFSFYINTFANVVRESTFSDRHLPISNMADLDEH